MSHGEAVEMSLHGWPVGIVKWCVAMGSAVVIMTGAGFGAAAAAPVPPTGVMGCGINGTIKVLPRLQTGAVNRVNVKATLTDCFGPLDPNSPYALPPGIGTGPAIHSGKLRVAGTGALLNPFGSVSGCNPLLMIWKPSTAWKIVWKAGPNGTGTVLGKSYLNAMTLVVNLPGYGGGPTTALFASIEGDSDWWTGGHASSVTGGFAGENIVIGNDATTIAADTSLCATRAGLKTITFSGPTGYPFKSYQAPTVVVGR